MGSNLYKKIGLQIREAREDSGVSQEDLAKKLGYSSPATISHFESGQRKISILDLQKVADSLDYPLNYFLEIEQTEPQIKRYLLRSADVRPSVREDVVKFLVFVHGNSVTAQSFPEAIAKQKIEKIVEHLLTIAEISAPPISPQNIAEKLDVPVYEWDFPNEISGIFVEEDNKCSIGINRYHPNVRQRFSIAHELAHYIFDRNEDDLFLDFDQNGPSNYFFDLKRQHIETKANRFAANLLMPRKWIKRDFEKIGGEIGLHQLALKYDVSEQAMWFRLLNLDLVKKI